MGHVQAVQGTGAGDAHPCKGIGAALQSRYLQNCRDEDEILSRLHGSVTWAALEPYMDWFSEANDEELHSRKAGRTWEQWRDEQPVRKFWVEHSSDEINFCDTMSAYLDKDVDALWELCDKLGGKFPDEFGADIRGKCTLGSIAEHIWSHTLSSPSPSWRQRRSTSCGNTPTVAAFAVPLARLISRRQRASRSTRWTSPPSTPHPLAPSSS